MCTCCYLATWKPLVNLNNLIWTSCVLVFTWLCLKTKHHATRSIFGMPRPLRFARQTSYLNWCGWWGDILCASVLTRMIKDVNVRNTMITMLLQLISKSQCNALHDSDREAGCGVSQLRSSTGETSIKHWQFSWENVISRPSSTSATLFLWCLLPEIHVLFSPKLIPAWLSLKWSTF